jgi:CRP-like cAMP-binding protein
VSAPIDILQQQLSLFHPLDGEALLALSRPWEEVSYKRKQVLTRAGDTERYLYLVLEGVQRAFYLDGEREATLVFSYAPSFSGVIDSFLLRQPSKYYLETLTGSKLLRIHYNDMNTLMQQHRSIETWVRIAVTKVLSGTLQREIELMAFNAEEKFTTLLHRSPQILNLIPHKYLASYIGVDPTTFSKMLSRVRL